MQLITDTNNGGLHQDAYVVNASADGPTVIHNKRERLDYMKRHDLVEVGGSVRNWNYPREDEGETIMETINRSEQMIDQHHEGTMAMLKEYKEMRDSERAPVADVSGFESETF